MHWTDRRERFRTLLAGAACIHPASVFDPISARVAEDLGFEIGMLAGSVASLAVLGAPDIVALTLTEFAEQALRINRAGALPLMVDADHGYGNAINVKRTVEELETAGVAALTIEDTELPRAFGAAGQTRLIPIDEGVGKMKAALAGRQDRSLVIAGRTGAAQITDLDDAIARARAYEAAGVDAVFLSGLKTPEQVERVADAIGLPIMLGGSGAGFDRAHLAANRVRIALQGHHPFMAAVKATHDTLKALRDGVTPAEIEGTASGAFMKGVMRDADYRRWMTEFLGG